MAQVPPAAPTGAQAAAAYLRELLLRPGRYRRKWEQYAERSRLGQVNQLAVAEVLAHYLWEHPRAGGDTDVLPRQLKDTASRALSGKLLSKATLTLFMDAFGCGALEREQLLKLWEGSARVRVLSGPRAIRDDKAATLGRPRLKTLSLHDHHYLGQDGQPARHRVIHVIEAVVDDAPTAEPTDDAPTDEAADEAVDAEEIEEAGAFAARASVLWPCLLSLWVLWP